MRQITVGAIFAAALLLGSVASGARHTGGSAPPRPISRDTSTGPGGAHQTETEPAAAAYGSTIVAAFQVGRGGEGALDTGWATSKDGGHTWRGGLLPELTQASSPDAPYVQTTDNAVAYDRVHRTWLISSLGDATLKPPFGALLVSPSSDGQDWSSPVVVDESTGPDKDWITCDNGRSSPHAGTCYALWTSDLPGPRSWSALRQTEG